MGGENGDLVWSAGRQGLLSSANGGKHPNPMVSWGVMAVGSLSFSTTRASNDRDDRERRQRQGHPWPVAASRR